MKNLENLINKKIKEIECFIDVIDKGRSVFYFGKIKAYEEIIQSIREQK